MCNYKNWKRRSYIAVDKRSGRQVKPGGAVRGPRGQAGVFLSVSTWTEGITPAKIRVRWDVDGYVGEYWDRMFGLIVRPVQVRMTGWTAIVPVTRRHQDAVRAVIPPAQLGGWEFGAGSLCVPYSLAETVAILSEAHTTAVAKYGPRRFPAAALQSLRKHLIGRKECACHA